MLTRALLAFIALCFTVQAHAAAVIGPAFSHWSSSSGGVVDAAKQGTNTMQVVGATLSKPGGKPTMIVLPQVTGQTIYPLDVLSKGPWADVRAYGAKGDGTTDDSAAIQAAVNASRLVFFPPATYRKSSEITIPSDRVIVGYGATVINTAETNGFTLTGDNITIYGLTIQGPQYTSQSTATGISAQGTVSAYLKNITVIDCTIKSWGIYGAQYAFVDGFSIRGTHIDGIFYAGFMGLSVQNGYIGAGTTVKNVTGSISSNAYGIAISRASASSLTDYPRSKNVTVEGVTVDNVPVWEGFDTHAGDNVKFIGCTATNCKFGIIATPSSNGSAEAYAPINCLISGNYVNSGKTDGSAQYGISIAGASAGGVSVEKATGTVTNNTVVGYGDQSNSIGGAIYLRDTRDLIISDNIVIEPSPIGINLYHDNVNVKLTNNVIIDAWSTDVAGAYGIGLKGSVNTGSMSGNFMVVGTKTAAYLNSNAIVAGSGFYGNSFTVSGTYSEYTSGLTDATPDKSALKSGSSNGAPVGGVWSLGDQVQHSSPSFNKYSGYTCTVAGGAYSTTRADTTAYTVGKFVAWPTGNTVWECIAGGNTAGSAPDITGKVVGDTVTDGTVTWALRSTAKSTWRGYGWIANKSNTASRPTPGASDIGVIYMDNTLDVDGLPIFWNGTKWIKADGTDA